MKRRAPWLLGFAPATRVAEGNITFGKWPDLAFAAIITLAIPYFASIVIPFVATLGRPTDPQNFWFLPTAHQVAATVLTVMLIRLLSGKPFRDWGFNLRNVGQGMLGVAIFAVAVSILNYFLVKSAPAPTSGIPVWQIVAILGTHLLIIGTTQEILYRGFLMGFLSTQWRGSYRIIGLELPVTGLLAAFIFVLSHVKPYPPYVWPAQLVLSLAYGVSYALIYHRTGSLLGPSLAHGYSNAAYVAMMMIKPSGD